MSVERSEDDAVDPGGWSMCSEDSDPWHLSLLLVLHT